MNNKFIKIDISLFQDENLNNTERIIFSYIQGFPDGYFSTLTFMADTLGQTRESISRNINHLVKKGYVERFVNAQNVPAWRALKKVTPPLKKVTDTVKNNHGQCEKRSRSPLKKVTESVKKDHTNNILKDNYKKFDKIVIPESEQKTEQPKQFKPSKKEVLDYFRSERLNGDAEKFYEHYSKYGWQYKGEPIVWKEKAKEWSSREFNSEPKAEIEHDEEFDRKFGGVKV